MNAKEYYCYGFLEKYGYNINGKITKKQFDNCFRREKLYDAANVEIYPENTSQADSVFLIRVYLKTQTSYINCTKSKNAVE